MMSEFTFGIITFNHAEVIFEHLESIKYQVIKYGKDYQHSIFINDDCSEDNTISVINWWVNLNKDIFYEVSIISHEKNKGIFQNFMDLAKRIRTDKSNILAGDDLYGPFNIFRVFGSKNDVIFTPTMNLKSDKLYIYNKYIYSLYTLVKPEHLKVLINRNMISAPGAFLPNGKLLDNEYFNFFKNSIFLVEDKPTWIYLFCKKKTSFKFSYKPYVIYRKDGYYRLNTMTKNKSSTEISSFRYSDNMELIDNFFKNMNCSKPNYKLYIKGLFSFVTSTFLFISLKFLYTVFFRNYYKQLKQFIDSYSK